MDSCLYHNRCLVCIVVEYKNEYKPSDKKGKIKNRLAYFSRIFFAVFFFSLGMLLLVHFKEQIFYLDERNYLLFDSKYKLSNDWPRFIWCAGCSLMGFGFAATQSRFSEKLPFFPYLFFYPCILTLITSLGYSLSSLYPITRGHLFYPLSFAICGTLGYRIDDYKDFVKGFLKSGKG